MQRLLVVVDMQNDFITGPLGNDESKAVVNNVCDVISSNVYDKVYVTMDTHAHNYMETMEGKHLPVEHCIKDTTGWKLHPSIHTALLCNYPKNTEIVHKPTFGSVELAYLLEKEYAEANGQIEIDFVGVCTGVCVISNVLVTKAHCPNAQISVIASACACVTPESHKNALKAMEMCHINIV